MLHAEPTDERLCEGSVGLGAKRSSHKDARRCLQEVGVSSSEGAGHRGLTRNKNLPPPADADALNR